MYTYGLGNYLGSAFTTGCEHNGKGCSNKTEILDMATLEWSDAPDYPYAEYVTNRNNNCFCICLIFISKISLIGYIIGHLIG